MTGTVKMDMFISGHCASLKLLGCIAVVAWCGLLLQMEWCGCLRVCWSVGDDCVPCKNVWTDRDVIGLGTCRPFSNYVLDTAQTLSREEALLRRHAQWSMYSQWLTMIGFRMIHADDRWTLVLSASGPLTAWTKAAEKEPRRFILKSA